MRIPLAFTMALAFASSCRPEQVEPVAQPSSTEARRALVAQLEKAVSEVKFREAGQLLWRTAENRQGFANYDAVKTGSASNALVRYNDHAALNLGENTLVIILHREERGSRETGDRIVKTSFALPDGSIDGTIDENAKDTVELEVRTTAGWIRASNRDPAGTRKTGARFKAVITPQGRLQVASEAGSVSFASAGRERRLAPREVIEIRVPSGVAEDPKRFELMPMLSDREWPASPSPVASGAAKPKAVIPNVFRVVRPGNRSVVAQDKTRIEGVLTGRLKVFFQGKEVKARPDGSFAVDVPLEPGANVFTFQVQGPGKDDFRYETLEITRP